MLAGGWSTLLLSSQGHQEGELEDGPCNGSKFLLLFAAGAWCRIWPGAATDNEHPQPRSQTVDILFSGWILCLWAETGKRFPAHGKVCDSSSWAHLHGGQRKAPSPARQHWGTSSFSSILPSNRCLPWVFGHVAERSTNGEVFQVKQNGCKAKWFQSASPSKVPLGLCSKGCPELSREGHDAGSLLLRVVLSLVGKKQRTLLQKNLAWKKQEQEQLHHAAQLCTCSASSNP